MEEASYKNSIHKYIQDKKVLYQRLHEYIDQSTDDIEEKYESLFQLINDQKIKEDKSDLSIFLNLIVKISNNINRYSTFFDRITKILIELKEVLKQTYTNHEIFNIFKSNKILLLFLFKEEIITIDKFIRNILESRKYKLKDYPSFFAPELARYNNSQVTDELYNKDPNQFEEYRKNGENIGEIAVLIRKDRIDEFISYVNQKEYKLNSHIEDSLFESNKLLLKMQSCFQRKIMSLIEYAAFYGSTQIFKYLYKNGVKLTPSLWIYGIHSDNPELISILEENHIKPSDETYNECFYESIKCHHNEMASYIKNNLMEKSQIKEDLFFKYYNFQYIEINNNQMTDLFITLCKYNYPYLIKCLLKESAIDVNAKTEKIERKCKSVKTALVLAVEKNFIEIVEILLTSPNINVNMPEKYFSTEIGFDVDIEEDDDNNDDYEVYEFDVATERDIYRSNSPLTIAIENEYIEITKLLLSHPYISVNSKHIIKNKHYDISIKSALILAIEKDYLEIVKLLLEDRFIDVNTILIEFGSGIYEKKTALYVAFENGNIEIIKELLLKENIDLNSKQIVKVEYPYEEWEDPTTKTIRCALNIAIDQHNIDIINLLLSHPEICINDQKDECFNYISYLSSYTEGRGGGGWYHSLPLIKEIINNPGCDFHLQYGEIIPALCYAIQNEQFEIAKAILSSKKDLDVNAKIKTKKCTSKIDEDDRMDIDKFVWSPCAKTKMPALCIAIEKNNYDIVKLLLSSPNIDVNADYLRESYSYIDEEEEEDTNNNKDDNWIYEKKIESPLHMAVESSNKEIIKLLFQNKKIDLNKVDDKNKKAIEYAQNDEIKELFQKFK